MNKKIVITTALAGLVLNACGSKESYRSIKGAFDRNEKPAPQVELSVEEKALQILEQDTAFQNLQGRAESLSLKNNLNAIEIQLKSEQSPTGLMNFEVALIDKGTGDCSVERFSSAAFAKTALQQNLLLKGFGRVQCIEKECNHLLLILESSSQDFPNGSTPQDAVSANVAILMAKADGDQFKPVSTESDVFAKTQNIEDGLTSCINALGAPTVPNATNTTNTTVNKGTEDLRKNITAIDYQMRNPQLTADQLNELKARRAKLLAQIQEIEARPQTGDEFAVQRLKEQQKQAAAQDKLTELNKKIKSLELQLKNSAIDAAAGKPLRVELEALKKERNQIVRERQLKAMEEMKKAYGSRSEGSQEPSTAVNPTLE